MANLKSTLLCRCPKCHEASVFEDPNPYHLTKLSKMVKRCPKCDFDLENETGFHFLSMYMSYIISVAFSFIFIIPASFILGLDWIPRIILINTILLVILWTLIFRWARMASLWAATSFKME